MSDCQEHSYIYTHEGNAHHTIYHYHKDDCPYCHIQELEQQKAKLVEALERIAGPDSIANEDLDFHHSSIRIAREALKEVEDE